MLGAVQAGLLIRPVVAAAGSAWGTTSQATFTYANGNRDVKATLNSWRSVRGTISRNAGKRYFEIRCAVLPTNSRIFVGVANASASMTGQLGQSASSTGSWPDGPVNNSSPSFVQSSGATIPAPNIPVAVGDAYTVAIDFAAQKLWWGQNSSWASGDPAAGTNPPITFDLATTGALFPALTLYAALTNGQPTSGTWTLCTAAGQCKNSPPSGFSYWDA